MQRSSDIQDLSIWLWRLLEEAGVPLEHELMEQDWKQLPRHEDSAVQQIHVSPCSPRTYEWSLHGDVRSNVSCMQFQTLRLRITHA